MEKMIENLSNLKKYEKILLLIFVLIEAVLFVLSYCNLSVTKYILYASIVVCFIASVLFARKSLSNLYVSIALLFTICADFVLLFLPQYKVLAMLFFCTVQIFYFLYLLKQTNGKQKQLNWWLRIAAVVISETVLAIIFADLFNLLAGLVIFYFVNLLVNMIFALINVKKMPLFAVGLIFFVLCDIFVGFGEMSLFFDVSSNAFFQFISSIPFNIAWTFYIPSQVLIVLGTTIQTKLYSVKKKKA